jgi:chromosome segregation protein
MSSIDPVINLDYQGALWVRVDLHLHSPGSFNMALPSGLDREKDHNELVKQYVQCLVKQNISVAAITDYQGVRPGWFKDIQRAAKQEEITIYPGAEISFAGPKHGLHILAVFPLDCEAEGVNRAIHALDENPAEPLIRKDGSHRDIRPKDSIEEALKGLRTSTNCLLIAAHPKDDNGFLKSYRTEDASQWLASVEPDAVEAFSDNEKQKMVSAHVLNLTELDRMASVEFSDPKTFEGIGNKKRPDGTPRATYVKLSVKDDLQALRLALHDPQILVSVGEKPQNAYTHLLGFEVEGSGFLSELKLAFSPELNVFVGGRGVGKSAILETIRYILNVSPFSPGEYRENLIQYALGSGGKANLYIEQMINPNVCRRYRLQRVWGEDTRIFELDNPEQEVPLTPGDLLGDQEGPLYFGQREIYDVTRQDAQRLKLLDEIVGRQADHGREVLPTLPPMGTSASGDWAGASPALGNWSSALPPPIVEPVEPSEAVGPVGRKAEVGMVGGDAEAGVQDDRR